LNSKRARAQSASLKNRIANGGSAGMEEIQNLGIDPTKIFDAEKCGPIRSVSPKALKER